MFNGFLSVYVWTLHVYIYTDKVSTLFAKKKKMPNQIFTITYQFKYISFFGVVKLEFKESWVCSDPWWYPDF